MEFIDKLLILVVLVYIWPTILLISVTLLAYSIALLDTLIEYTTSWRDEG